HPFQTIDNVVGQAPLADLIKNHHMLSTNPRQISGGAYSRRSRPRKHPSSRDFPSTSGARSSARDQSFARDKLTHP
ncbi:hypothetical protein, partial [Pseudomonas monteilii]|uniref:hypothetical protein n=1 Tax=Pseudomonas monteilii TaxID=76759 RepID=UPI001F31941E